MSDETNEVVTDEQHAEDEERSPEADGVGEPVPGDGEPGSEEGSPEAEGSEQLDEALSPDDAREVARKARREAAKYRTKVRELEQKLENVESIEQVQELVTQIKQEAAAEAHRLLVENVALQHSLPADLAEALKGSTREELEAHAKVLAKYAPSGDPDVDRSKPTGGLTPGSSGEVADPVAAARRALRRKF